MWRSRSASAGVWRLDALLLAGNDATQSRLVCSKQRRRTPLPCFGAVVLNRRTSNPKSLGVRNDCSIAGA